MVQLLSVALRATNGVELFLALAPGSKRHPRRRWRSRLTGEFCRFAARLDYLAGHHNRGTGHKLARQA
jgi:hypothetical protein